MDQPARSNFNTLNLNEMKFSTILRIRNGYRIRSTELLYFYRKNSWLQRVGNNFIQYYYIWVRRQSRLLKEISRELIETLIVLNWSAGKFPPAECACSRFSELIWWIFHKFSQLVSILLCLRTTYFHYIARY